MTEYIVVTLFAVAFATGVYATVDLHSLHYAQPEPRNRITFAIYVVALVITLAAGWFGFWPALRLMGLGPFPQTIVPSLLIASAVLFLPLFLRITVSRIRRERQGGS